MGSLARAADPTDPYYPGFPQGEAYRASKSALNMVALQEIAQLEGAPLKIFIMCPGLVRSNLRGKDEEAISAGGRAGDPADSGRLMLDIIQGGRDADIGKFIHSNGIYSW